MVIKKFVKIANVGRFSKLSPHGDVELRPLSLLYGENGHGKTTIAGVLRSLQTGDAAYLSERATLGATGDQTVEILLSAGQTSKFSDGTWTQTVEILLSAGQTSKFSGGTWTQTVADIEIFDSVFVRENVYAGDSVENEHRKNLYDVVVGATGVALRNRIDELDGESRRIASKLRETEEALDSFKQAPFTLDQFLELEPDPDVEEKIRTATTKLNAIRNSKKILGRKSLDELSLPEAPRKTAALLKTRVEQVAGEAVERVKTHIQKRLGAGGEAWVRQGLTYGADKECPFCGQATTEAELLRHFTAYFSDTYDEKVVELRRALNRLEQDFGDRAWAQVQQATLENDAAIQTWSDLADLSNAKVSLDRLEKAWRHLFEVLQRRLNEKLASPTQVPADDTIVEAALQDYEEAASLIRELNDRIKEANDKIDGLKRDAASTDETVIETELRALRNSQIRRSPEVDELCRALVAHRQDRARLTKEKDEAKEQLEQQAGAILERYEASINGFLERFGASFRMTGTKPAFPGGRATSTYKIAIRDVAVDLGDSRTQPGTVCFRTALSTGDRSTLALAFFLARLDQDPNLGNKLVLFDDPLSSLDCFRASCTQQEIRRIAHRAAQVVVLSHDAFFLKAMYDDERSAKTLHIVGRGDTHQMKEWDIEEHCSSQAHRDYFVLNRFLTEGSPTGSDVIAVASRVRPYVEDYVRHKYPGEFRGLMTLGDCIQKIREAPGSDGVGAFKPKLQELEDINEFGRRFMHGGSTAPAPPSEAELEAYVRRSITLVQEP